MMLLVFLQLCSVVSAGHGLTHVEMEKTLLVEQNYRKLPSGQKQFVSDQTGR